MYVIEPCQSQVDASKHVHGVLSGTSRMPVATLDTTFDPLRPHPDKQIEVENREVLQRDGAVPPSKDVHVLIVDHSCVTKPYLWLLENLKAIWYHQLLLEIRDLVIGQGVELAHIYKMPSVLADVILMHVRENVSFIPPSVDKELAEVPDEGMVGSGSWSVLRHQVDPLILICLKLSQVVEVGPSLSCVATKQVYAVLVRDTMSPRAGEWLLAFRVCVQVAYLLPCLLL